MPSLTQTRQELIDVIKEGIDVIASMDPVATIGQYFESVSSGFQGLAICNLLLNMDTAGFAKNLVLSGYTRRYYLTRNAAEGGTENQYAAISRTTAFFDAIVGGSSDTSRQIAAMSPDHWIADGEYEDDYCYQAFLQQYLQHGPQHPGLPAILSQFLKSLEDAPNARWSICKSLLQRDAELFSEAFGQLIAGQQEF